jgi:hypothetical protein
MIAKRTVPCCPQLDPDGACDVLDFFYRLVHNTRVTVGQQRQVVPVEVKIHVRFERCPGPLALGDLIYSNTLLPGEKVRLFTSDRRTRFTFDNSTKVSYRNEQTSEERFFMGSISDSMSDLRVRNSASSSNTAKGSAEGHGETSSFLGSIFSGPSVDVSGSYSAESTSDFMSELSSHAQASTRRSEQGARASSSTSIGEVQTRTHTEGESDDHFESSSREFSNPNHCRAVTFFFYQINKTQVVRFTVASITRRVIDPAADTKVDINPFVSRGDVSTIPNGVLATDPARLKVEETARQSAASREAATVGVGGAVRGATTVSPNFRPARGAETDEGGFTQPFRAKALRQVDEDLIKAGLLDEVGGGVSEGGSARFSFEIRSSIPTPGVFVRGCLDECDICEPEVQRAIELELENKALQNDLLRKQIELLERSQEYRCCPAGAAEDEDDE